MRGVFPYFVLLFFLFCQSWFTAANDVTIRVQSYGAEDITHNVEVCNTIRRGLSVSLQNYNTHLYFSSSVKEVAVIVWSQRQNRRVAGMIHNASMELSIEVDNMWRQDKTINVMFELPKRYTCDECSAGFQKISKNQLHECRACPPMTATVHDLCSRHRIPDDLFETLCKRKTMIVNQMVFHNCPNDGNGDEKNDYQVCTDSINTHLGSWVVQNDTIIPTSNHDCQRLRTCPHGFYMNDQTTRSHCLACNDRGSLGMNGIPQPLNPNEPLQGVSLEKSCFCDKGMFFDRKNLFCTFCREGTFSSEASLNEICTNCSSCHGKHLIGATRCTFCADGEYFSNHGMACRACPSSWTLLESNPDFVAAGTREDYYLNMSRCDEPENHGCGFPTNFLVRRTSCPPGQYATWVSDVQDTHCLPCLSETYTDTFSAGFQPCKPKQLCSGDFFAEPSDNVTTDRICVQDDIQMQLQQNKWQYPVTNDINQQVAFKEHRSFNISNVLLQQCEFAVPNVTDLFFYENALYDHWKENTSMRLPFLKTPTCVYKCRPGSYRLFNTCVQCPVGHYSIDFDSSNCQPCAPGFFQDQPGASNCSSCPVSTFQNKSGQTSCQACCQLGANDCTACGCSPQTSFLNGACDQPAQTQCNCRQCPDRPFQTNVQTWNTMGLSHCFQQPDCPVVVNSVGFENLANCKPLCAQGMYAERDSAEAVWTCKACSTIGRACKPGTFFEVACKNNQNTACVSCDTNVSPFTRFLPTSDQTGCQQSCRVPQGTNDNMLYFLTVVQVAHILHIPIETVNGCLQRDYNTSITCIPSTTDTDLCPLGKVPFLDLQRLNAVEQDHNSLLSDFEPNVWPYLHCTTPPREVKIGEKFVQNLCGDDAPNRRRLMSLENICEENFFRAGEDCVQCPYGKQSFEGAESPADCFCSPGFFENRDTEPYSCVMCPRNSNFYCPGGYFADSKPSNADRTGNFFEFSCGRQESAVHSQCSCPAQSSTEFFFAKSAFDCIPEAGFYWNTSLLELEQYVTAPCPVPSAAPELTTFVKQFTSTQIFSKACVFECREEGTVENDNGMECVCDDSKNFVYHTEFRQCMCKGGFFMQDGQCTLCPLNSFCVNNTRFDCGLGMVTTGGSSSLQDCQCDVGMYRAGSPSSFFCQRCPVSYYCPDGMVPISCDNQFFCDTVGLSRPSTCQPGQIPSFQNEFKLCLDIDLSLQASVQRTEDKPYLFLNMLQQNANETFRFTLFNPAIFPDMNIVGMPDIGYHEAHEQLSLIDSISYMLSVFQLFCTDNGVLIATDPANSIIGPGKVACLSSQTLSRFLVSTTNNLPLQNFLGKDSFLDPSTAQADIDNTLQLFHYVYPHLTWAVYLACETTLTSWLNHSSELEICNADCSGQHKYAHHVAGFVQAAQNKPFVSEMVTLDVPSQQAWLQHYDIETPSHCLMYVHQFRDAQNQLQASVTVHIPQFDLEREFVLPTYSLPQNQVGKIMFAVPMRRWRYFSSFKPTLLLGMCTDDNRFFLLHYAILQRKILMSNFETSAVPVCDASFDFFSMSAHVHLYHLYVFRKQNNAQTPVLIASLNKDFAQFTAEALATETQQTWQGHEIENFVPGNYENIQWHTSCASSFSLQHVPSCSMNIFARANETLHFFFWDDATLGNSQNRFFHTSYPYTSDVIFHREDLEVQFSGQIEMAAYEVTHVTLLTTSNVGDYRNTNSNPADRTFEFLVSIERKPSALIVAQDKAVYFVRVLYNATQVHMHLLSPIFLSGRIHSLSYHLAPSPNFSPLHPAQAQNVLPAVGRLVVNFQARNDAMQFFTDTFDFRCSGCVGEHEIQLADGSCTCIPGTAPIAIPCYDHCSASRVSFSVDMNSDIYWTPIVHADDRPNAFVHLCVPCNGPFYCPTGRKEAVSTCPTHTYATKLFATLPSDCQCDNQTRLQAHIHSYNFFNAPGLSAVAVQKSDTGIQQTCQACTEQEICNAYTNQLKKMMLCNNHTQHRQITQSGSFETTVFDTCECQPGFYSVNSNSVRANITLSHFITAYSWNQSSVFHGVDATANRHLVMTQHDCDLCPPNFFCVAGKRYACGEHFTSSPGSEAPDDCVCMNGFRFDNQSMDCQPCQHSLAEICVDNRIISCPDQHQHFHPACPCPVNAGKAMVREGGVCENACPANFFCPIPTLGSDPVLNNQPQPCPSNMISLPGSVSLSDCSCQAGFYKFLDACVPCPLHHWCDGFMKQSCPTGKITLETHRTHVSHCVCQNNTNGCSCDFGYRPVPTANGLICELCDDHPSMSFYGNKCQCSPGFVQREYATEFWQQYKRLNRNIDNPLWPEMRLATMQFDTLLLQAQEENAECVLCPPEAICKGHGSIQIPSKEHAYAVLRMGASADNQFALCPKPRGNGLTFRLQGQTPMGLSSCFAKPILMQHAKGDLFAALSSKIGNGLILFDTAETYFSPELWNSIMTKNMESYQTAMHVYEVTQIFPFFISTTKAAATFEINIASVMLRYFEVIPSVAARDTLFAELLVIDAGTGILSELFLNTLWALVVNNDGLNYHHNTDTNVLGEAIIVIQSVVKTPATGIIAMELVHRITQACTGEKRPWKAQDAPKIVFSTHMQDFQNMGVTNYLLTLPGNVYYVHHALCAVAHDGLACPDAHDGLMLSYTDILTFPDITNAYLFELADSSRLHATLLLTGKISQATTAICPFGMTMITEHSTQFCSPCMIEFYTETFYDALAFQCAPCLAIDQVECTALGNNFTKLACLYTQNGQCV